MWTGMLEPIKPSGAREKVANGGGLYSIFRLSLRISAPFMTFLVDASAPGALRGAIDRW